MTGTFLTGTGLCFPDGSTQTKASVSEFCEITTSTVWCKPSGAQWVEVEIWGGGGGGGVTGCDVWAGTYNYYASGGGGGGAYSTYKFKASDLPSSVCVIIGSGGCGALASCLCCRSTAGGTSCFGCFLCASGGCGARVCNSYPSCGTGYTFGTGGSGYGLATCGFVLCNGTGSALCYCGCCMIGTGAGFVTMCNPASTGSILFPQSGIFSGGDGGGGACAISSTPGNSLYGGAGGGGTTYCQVCVNCGCYYYGGNGGTSGYNYIGGYTCFCGICGYCQYSPSTYLAGGAAGVPFGQCYTCFTGGGLAIANGLLLVADSTNYVYYCYPLNCLCGNLNCVMGTIIPPSGSVLNFSGIRNLIYACGCYYLFSQGCSCYCCATCGWSYFLGVCKTADFCTWTCSLTSGMGAMSQCGCSQNRYAGNNFSNCVTFFNCTGKFYTYDCTGTIFQSSDGITWTCAYVPYGQITCFGSSFVNMGTNLLYLNYACEYASACGCWMVTLSAWSSLNGTTWAKCQCIRVCACIPNVCGVCNIRFNSVVGCNGFAAMEWWVPSCPIGYTAYCAGLVFSNCGSTVNNMTVCGWGGSPGTTTGPVCSALELTCCGLYHVQMDNNCCTSWTIRCSTCGSAPWNMMLCGGVASCGCPYAAPMYHCCRLTCVIGYGPYLTYMCIYSPCCSKDNVTAFSVLCGGGVCYATLCVPPVCFLGYHGQQGGYAGGGGGGGGCCSNGGCGGQGFARIYVS